MLEAGAIINQRYQLQAKLGRNAGRQTWLAKDLHSQSQEKIEDVSLSDSVSDLVVVKLLAFGGDVQWEDLKLFEREAQILQQLNHDRIPKYQDYFAIDDRNLWFGLVQEYIPGDSLRELLDKGKRFSELEVKKIAKDILNILVYLHDFKPPLLHRDIKPSNLILGTDNRIYLVDFGAVQDRAATEGATFTVVGTYGYAPMEQFGGKAVPASDLYALGTTLIHLLTRTAPADLPVLDLRIQFKERVSLKLQLADWLEKITHPAVEKRYQTARQALKALEASERPSDVNFMRSNYTKNSLLFSRRIKVANEKDHLEITISKRSIKKVQDAINLFVALVFFFISGSLCLSFFPLGIIALIICYSAFCPYLDYLFGETKVLFNHQKFLIRKQLFFSGIQNQGITQNIQDVSINYQALHEQKAFSLNDVSAIIVTTNKSERHQRGYQQYKFGKGLTEEESIWIANEVRHWLSNR